MLYLSMTHKKPETKAGMNRALTSEGEVAVLMQGCKAPHLKPVKTGAIR